MTASDPENSVNCSSDPIREVPKEILMRLSTWFFYFRIWRSVHYILGFTATLASLTVAARPKILSPVALETIAWVSVIIIGVFTFLKSAERANAYVQAWRTLDHACDLFRFVHAFTIRDLLDAKAMGESAIQQHDLQGGSSKHHMGATKSRTGKKL